MKRGVAVVAALFAVAMMALSDPKIKKALDEYRAAQTAKVMAARLP